jgi:hypothetical protein
MEFLLLAAIFLTSSGFLVGAAVAPAPSVAIAPAPVPASEEAGPVSPQPAPKLSGLNAPLSQPDPECLRTMGSRRCVFQP